MLRKKLCLIEEKRARSEPLPTGSYAYTTSSFYKTQKAGDKPAARSLQHRFSTNCQAQTRSPLKTASMGPKPGQKRTITLAAARPAPEFFPWRSISQDLAGGHPEVNHRPRARVANGVDHGAASLTCRQGEAGFDLGVALNYGYSAGSPQLVRFLTEHVELIHDPPYDDWETILTCGTTSATEIAFRIFCNPGDTVLVEDHTYTGAVAAAKAQELNVAGVKMDAQGLLPEDLDRILSCWDLSQGPKPSVLYTIPCGQNPTGTTQTTERRKCVYEVAVRHDLYIIEDDPYYFLQLGTASGSAEDFLRELPRSYLSLDVEGRVMRLDSFSKILSPGLRCGWVTASSEVMEKFLAYSEVGVLSVSGVSQVMIYKLLDETWGHEGFLEWLNELSGRYSQQRDSLVRACEQFLPVDVCSWEVPTTGMFVWVRINTDGLRGGDARARRAATTESVSRQLFLDLEDRIYKASLENGALVAKGSWFEADLESSLSGVHFRLTFAAAAEADLAKAVAAFGAAVKDQIT